MDNSRLIGDEASYLYRFIVFFYVCCKWKRTLGKGTLFRRDKCGRYSVLWTKKV